jgi:ParB-like chromosome segregation protein Spo0J
MEQYQFLPSLQLDEYEALRESIRKYGVIQPVITDEDGNIIDGYHRVKICQELGIAYPTRIMEGLTEEEKENLAVSLNIKRRHLTKEQKKTLAIELRERGWTQERIAGVMEVAQQTISRWITHLSKLDQPSPTPCPNPELVNNAHLSIIDQPSPNQKNTDSDYPNPDQQFRLQFLDPLRCFLDCHVAPPVEAA